MALQTIYNVNKEKIGEIELNDSIFSLDVNVSILHEIVKMQLANRRAGTAATKSRGEVAGSSKKPWRQKGTGRARAGHKRSPLWRGGGIIHGPKPRCYAYDLPKKVKKLGLCMALSARCQEEAITVIDDFKIDQIKTKRFADVLKKFSLNNALIITPQRDETLEKSSRNIPGIKVIATVGLNVYDILLHKHVILLQSTIVPIEQRLIS